MDDELLDSFFRGLHLSILAEVLKGNPNTFEKAYNFAETYSHLDVLTQTCNMLSRCARCLVAKPFKRTMYPWISI